MARSCKCPKCDADISDTWQESELDVGINAGWFCDACDLGVVDEGGYEPMEGDVEIAPAPRSPDGKYGVPASMLRGRVPALDDFEGQVKFDNWKRLCRSWGYD